MKYDIILKIPSGFLCVFNMMRETKVILNKVGLQIQDQLITHFITAACYQYKKMLILNLPTITSLGRVLQTYILNKNGLRQQN